MKSSLADDKFYQSIERVIKIKKRHASQETTRNILMLKLYLYTDLSTKDLVKLTDRHLDTALRKKGCNISIEKAGYAGSAIIPLDLLKDELLEYLKIREWGSFLFCTYRDRHTPVGREYFMDFVYSVLDQSGVDYPANEKNIPNFLKKKLHETLDGLEDEHPNRVCDLESLKIKLRTYLDNPVKVSREKFDYVCAECGTDTDVMARNAEEFLGLMVERSKLCKECFYNMNEASLNAENAKDDAFRKKKNKDRYKKRIMKKKKEVSKVNCEVCGERCHNKTNASVQVCSDKCKKKYNETKRFYKRLSRANNEIDIAKVRVYGQGRYEQIHARKTEHGKKWDVLKASTVDTDSVKTDMDIFEEEAVRYAKKIISSEKGREMGLEFGDIEEVVLTAYGHKMKNKNLNAEACVNLALNK